MKADYTRKTDFLAGGGEMGDRIRAFRWGRTTIGPPGTWPQSLRTVVRIMLSTNHPMFVFWGPEHICFYNDAYAALLGPEKHPAMLGAPGREMWPEIWHIIGPQIADVLGGRGATWHKDHLVPIVRHGGLQEVYWTYSYSPIDDEAAQGGVGGVLVVCTETTERVLTERRLSFQLELEDRLRELSAPQEVMAVAAETLGRHLRAGRCGYGEAGAESELFRVSCDWTDGSMPSLASAQRPPPLGREMLAELAAGRVVRIDDVATDPRTGGIAPLLSETLGMRAAIAAPLRKDGRLVAVLYADQTEPRRWTDDEAELVASVAERTWSAVQRARAEARLLAAAERMHTIQAAADIGTFEWDVESGRIFRSAEYLQLQGLPAADGEIGVFTDAWLDRVHPEDRAKVAQYFNEDLSSAGRFEREYRIVRPDTGETRWILNRGRIERGPDGRAVRLLSAQTDITERKRAELHQQLLIAELNHRVKNTLATVQSLVATTLRETPSPEEIREKLEARLIGLARAHDVLTRENWASAKLNDIVEQALAPFAAERQARFEWSGPEVRLAPNRALAFAMALQELSTNAVKYGALSTPTGRVSIAWRVDRRPAPWLRFDWAEQGGPPVRPPERRGFGARLLQEGLARDLGGAARLSFLPSGLVCEIEAPL